MMNMHVHPAQANIHTVNGKLVPLTSNEDVQCTVPLPLLCSRHYCKAAEIKMIL